MVLVYHRVAELPRDPQLLSVSPRNFQGHLRVLREAGRVIPLSEMAERVRAGSVLHGSFCVTFDDGYADNLHHAAPALEAARLPATFFITSGHVSSGREFWWDELERLLLASPVLPESLELDLAGRVFRWSFRDDAQLPSDPWWNVLSDASQSARQKAYCDLCDALRTMPAARRESLLSALRRWAGDSGAARDSHRALTAAELMALARVERVEIGAHGVHHVKLSSLDAEAQRQDIMRSRATLEEISGRRVEHFAYPFGARTDYTPETKRELSDLGFKSACANFPETVTRRSDAFEIPRFVVRNWNEATFRRHLGSWLNG